mgnify:CR=1 FL=1
MQNIDLICVGKLNAKYFAEGVAEYQKRLAAFAAFRILELPEEKIEEKNASDAVVKKALDKEGKAILSNVRKGAAIVAMCIEGKQISSDELAQFLAQRAGSGAGDVAFVIGSSHGLSDEVKKAAALTAGAHRADLPRLHHQCGHEVPQVKGDFELPERLRTLRELFLQKSVKTAGKVIFGFSFGTDFIILITWSDLLQNTAKNTGWKNHGKIQKRTAAGGLPAGTGNVCGAALQLPASRKSRQLYGSDAGHRGGQR